MLQTREVAVAVAVPVAVEVVVSVLSAVAALFTRVRPKRHLSLQTTHLNSPTGSGNSSGCWRCSSLNNTSSMSDYVSARVKQRLEEVKRHECSLRQRQGHGKMLSRITKSYSSSR